MFDTLNGRASDSNTTINVNSGVVMTYRGLVLMCVCTALEIASASDTGVTAKKLIVVDKHEFPVVKGKITFVAKHPAVTKGEGEDPLGISAAFYVTYGNGSVAGAFSMPAGGGWAANKQKMAKYVNKAAPGGPTQVKLAVIKPGKLLKLVAKGIGDVPFDILGVGAPGAAGVQTAYCVENSGEENCHCSIFAACKQRSIARGTGAKLVCKRGAADPECGAITRGEAAGCSDGEREGFLDIATHPDIAGCSGGWSVAGTLAPTRAECGDAGDDSPNPAGNGCGAEDLCSVGWHVCATPAEVAALSPDGCASATQGGDPDLFFAQRQSGEGSGECGPSGANDLFGCGNMGTQPGGTCDPLDRSSGDLCSALSTGGWDCSAATPTTEATGVVKTGADGGGVLCCRAPVATITTTTTSTTTTTICVQAVGSLCDLGDGTVYDSVTHLQWEQKDTAVGSGVNAANLHDADNVYSWAGFCTSSIPFGKLCQPSAAAEAACKAQTEVGFWMEGGCEQCTGDEGTCDVNLNSNAITTVWDWLSQMNAATFAGHSDWRLPSESGCNSCYTDGAGGLYQCTSCDAHELETILVSSAPCGIQPCIASIFGPTPSFLYWSASTGGPTDLPQTAWIVNFDNGLVAASYKERDGRTGFHVRAVRDPPGS